MDSEHSLVGLFLTCNHIVDHVSRPAILHHVELVDLRHDTDTLLDPDRYLEHHGDLHDPDANLDDSRPQGQSDVHVLSRVDAEDADEDAKAKAKYRQNVEHGEGEDSPLALLVQVVPSVKDGESEEQAEQESGEVS